MATVNALSVALFNAAAGGYAADMTKNPAAYAAVAGTVLQKDLSTDAAFIDNVLGNFGITSTTGVYAEAKAAMLGMVASQGRAGAVVAAIDFLNGVPVSSPYAAVASAFAAKVAAATAFSAANSKELDVTKLISAVTGVDTDQVAIDAAVAAAVAKQAAADKVLADAAAAKAAADLKAANDKAAADLAAANAKAAADLKAAQDKAAADLAAAKADADAAAAKAAADLKAANDQITALKNPAGTSQTLTTGTDTLIGTAGNDTFTGLDTSSTTTDTYSDNDRVIDSLTTDNDTYNLTLVDTATPNVVNVENVNITLNKTSLVAIDAAQMAGVKTLTVTRGNVEVGGSTITGNKAVTVSNLNADAVAAVTVGAATTDVIVNQKDKGGSTVNANTATGDVTVRGAATVIANAMTSTKTLTIDAFQDGEVASATSATTENAKAVSVTTSAGTVSVADDTNKFTGSITVTAPAATSVTVANAVGGATVTAGTTSTADTTITVSNIDDSGATIVTGTGYLQTTTPVKEITINLDGTSATTDAASITGAGYITVNQDNTDLVENLTFAGSDDVTYALTGTLLPTITLAGSKSVTIKGDGALFTGKKVTDSTTGGSTQLNVTTLGADADLSLVTTDSILVSATGTSRTLTLATGANVRLGADQTTAFAVAGKVAGATINLATADDTDASGATIDIQTDTLTASSNVSVLNVDATVGKLTMATATTLATTGTLNINGTKAVALGSVTAKAVNAANATGAISLTAGDAALKTVTTGSGADTLTLNTATVYTVDTGAGADTLTIGANASAAGLFATGTGDDTITLNSTAAVVVVAGDGNDSLTIGGATTDAILAMGDGTDTVTFGAAMDLSSATNFSNFAMTGVETVDITAANGTVKIRAAAFAQDNVFKLTGDSATADILHVVHSSATPTTIDASGVTFASTQNAALYLEGNTKADTIIGSSKNDRIIGTKGGDTIDGGSGTDTFSAVNLDAAQESTTTQNLSSSGVAINLGATAVTAANISNALSDFLANDLASLGSGKYAYLYDTADSTNSSVIGTLSSIENIIGSDGPDYIVGSADANTITGGTGADYITPGAGSDVIVYTSTSVAVGGADDLVSGTYDSVVGFTTSDSIDLSAVEGSLKASAGAAGAGGVVAAMADSSTFTNGAVGAIEFYDNGTDTFIRISTAANTGYTSAADIDVVKLVGITGHTFTLSAAGILTMDA